MNRIDILNLIEPVQRALAEQADHNEKLNESNRRLSHNLDFLLEEKQKNEKAISDLKMEISFWRESFSKLEIKTFSLIEKMPAKFRSEARKAINEISGKMQGGAK